MLSLAWALFGLVKHPAYALADVMICGLGKILFNPDKDNQNLFGLVHTQFWPIPVLGRRPASGKGCFLLLFRLFRVSVEDKNIVG